MHTATPRIMTAPEDTGIACPVVDPGKLPGNASLELKHELAKLWPLCQLSPDQFASSIGARLELVEVSVVPKREDEQVMEARIVGEIDVVPGAKTALEIPDDIMTIIYTPEMLNLFNFTHGGCIAYLIDM